ncbi:hypothetical protein M2T92_16300 [Elizabethkingia miricola]|uniref:hypothetical protein n=1 Tax=Elizabethkingia miricola TaxID=172045 RepID=UPI002013A447|nr:hypothetical protein [Elizabethkingia miricola]MCL1680601.1 hypothetical protein [Elizabethkingia miricola]
MKKLDLTQMENLQGNGKDACTISTYGIAGIGAFVPAIGFGAAVYAIGCYLYFK